MFVIRHRATQWWPPTQPAPSTHKMYGLSTRVHPIMKIGFESFKSLNDPTMWKLGMTQRLPCSNNNEELGLSWLDSGTRLQDRFNDGGCFIEKEGWLIARGRREGWKFILDSHEMKSAMFAKGHRSKSNIELCQKRIGHINMKECPCRPPLWGNHATPRGFCTIEVELTCHIQESEAERKAIAVGVMIWQESNPWPYVIWVELWPLYHLL